MIPCPPPDFAPRRPSLALPPGATDCHAHIFGPEAFHPYADTRGYTPPDCLLSHYRHMLATVGLARAVLVQPTVYGTDNAVHLAAMAEAGPGFRMVAVVDAGVTDDELARMNAAGVRGLRLNAITPGGIGLEPLETLAARVAPLGWHIQLYIGQDAIAGNESRLAALPVPVVFDHMGQATPATGTNHSGFRAMIRLLESGRGWVKLSGAYRLSAHPVPPFSDQAPIARALIAANPERMLWGSDWPHPMVNDRPMPNDGDLVDLLADWAPGEVERRRILVDNPARLYGFA